MSDDLNFWQIIGTVVATIIGCIALGWQIKDALKQDLGFMQLDITNSVQKNGSDDHIICKTFIENTSRKPIKIFFTFVLLIHESTSETQVVDDLNIKLAPINLKIENPQFFDIWKVKKLLGNTTTSINGNGYSIQSLPYYYVKNDQLGSLEHLQDTIVYKVPQNGIYSVRFYVIGENWIKKKTLSHYRLIHDKVIV